jgi:hypothetical protein
MYQYLAPASLSRWEKVVTTTVCLRDDEAVEMLALHDDGDVEMLVLHDRGMS